MWIEKQKSNVLFIRLVVMTLKRLHRSTVIIQECTLDVAMKQVGLEVNGQVCSHSNATGSMRAFVLTGQFIRCA